MIVTKELQFLFTTMAAGNNRYIDPRRVLEAVLDDQGDKVSFGEEKDISEYKLLLVSRI